MCIGGEKIMMIAVLSVLSKYDNVKPMIKQHFRAHEAFLLEKVTERLYDANKSTRAKAVLQCTCAHPCIC